MNIILQQFALFQNSNMFNQLIYNPSFNLKQRIDFKNMTAKKSKNIFNQCEKEIFTLKDFYKLLDMHQLYHFSKHDIKEFSLSELLTDEVMTCRSIIQTCLCLRFQNTLDLLDCKVEKKRCNCTHGTICKYPTINCFNKILFSKSKTGSFYTYMIDQIYSCFQFLSHFNCNTTKNYDIIYSHYSNFLIKNFHHSSHKLRRFLPNLIKNESYLYSNNVGNWSSTSKTIIYKVIYNLFCYTILLKRLIIKDK